MKAQKIYSVSATLIIIGYSQAFHFQNFSKSFLHKRIANARPFLLLHLLKSLKDDKQ
jgi:hypothetical protein